MVEEGMAEFMAVLAFSFYLGIPERKEQGMLVLFLQVK